MSTARTTLIHPPDPSLAPALRLATAFAAAKLLFTFALTLYTLHIGYSYFRDEFYYLACGRHLAWGFVDHGPLVALQARVGELLFGTSVFAIRILPAIAGALTVFLTGLLAWALGGRRPAQALSLIAILVTPQYIGIDGFLSMNCWEPVFWMVPVLALLLIQRGHSPALWWTVLGLSSGLGLLNKHSMVFFLVAVGLGLLCTPARRLLFSRWTALAIALMVLIALPNLLWQIHNHWPTLEFLENGRRGGKNVVLGPLAFFFAQVFMLHPLNALVWIPGLIALLRQRSIGNPHPGSPTGLPAEVAAHPGSPTGLPVGVNARWLGLTYLFFYGVMFALHAKDYYLEGIYPALLAAGGIAWEHRFAARRPVRENRILAFPVATATLLITGLIILPMSSPILRPATWVRYTAALHLRSNQQETLSTGPLPQFFADRFGWNEEVALVLAAYRSLPPADRARVCLFGSNYGEAGAIDLLGARAEPGLPPAISGQNTYWLWGTHGCDPNLVIAVVHDTRDQLRTKYVQTDLIGSMDHPYSMPFEHRNVWLLRGRRPSAPFHWADERFYF